MAAAAVPALTPHAHYSHRPSAGGKRHGSATSRRLIAVNAADFEASLEAIAAHMGDPVEAVYSALFARNPALEALFVLDTDGAVRGEMLARVFENLESLVSEAGYAEQLMQSEYINHCAMGIPDGGFTLFMDVLVETFSEALGESWTPEFATVWRDLQNQVQVIEASTSG